MCRTQLPGGRLFMRSHRPGALTLAPLVLILAACSGPPPPPPAAAPRPDPWPQLATRFIEDYFKANPSFAVQSGRHDFDGQMEDLSAEAIAAEVARLKRSRAEIV